MGVALFQSLWAAAKQVSGAGQVAGGSEPLQGRLSDGASRYFRIRNKSSQRARRKPGSARVPPRCRLRRLAEKYQQRLECVVILAVNQSDFDRFVRQCFRCIEATETAPDDDYSLRSFLH